MKRRTVLLILSICLLAGGLSLLSPGEGAWATPAQNPQRQSIPTLTPTPANSPPPPATPGDTPPPVETASLPSPALPSPPPASPSPPVVTQAAGDETSLPTATEEEKAETATSTPASTPAPSNTPRKPGATMTPLAPPVPASAFGTQSAIDLIVMGSGLALLVIGLILIWRRRNQSPRP